MLIIHHIILHHTMLNYPILYYPTQYDKEACVYVVFLDLHIWHLGVQKLKLAKRKIARRTPDIWAVFPL